MGEDENSKVRRNLVALSFAVIVGWITDVSVTKLPIFGLSISTEHPGRVWFALLLALVYMNQRYHFADDTMSAWSQLGEKYTDALKAAATRLLSKEIQRVTVKKRSSSVLPVLNAGTLLEQAKNTPAVINFSGECSIIGPVEALKKPRDVIYLLKQGHIAIIDASYMTKSSSVRSVQRGTTTNVYELSTFRHAALVVMTTVKFLIHSKPSIELLVPYLLGAIALVISVAHLVPIAYAKFAM